MIGPQSDDDEPNKLIPLLVNINRPYVGTPSTYGMVNGSKDQRSKYGFGRWSNYRENKC